MIISILKYFYLEKEAREVWILKIAGSAFPAFLDFSVGVFLVFLLGYFLEYNAALYGYALGGILALAPDFDVAFMFLWKHKVYGNHHEYITHRPLIMIAAAFIIGAFTDGFFWAIAAPLCVFWHFVHDTEGLGGGGIAWLWPFSKKYLSPITGVVSPKHSLAAQFQGKYDRWLDTTWLVPSKTSLIELVAGSILFSIAAKAVLGWRMGAVLLVLLWICVISVWLAFSFLKART
ncbi:metal-dependent hydrolase [Candidatus Gottesmanbacteria bacterium]|nr:metal-dependent hydrolase [Candidatus Niyogibacteria bacterium]MBI2405239.1 metal-dependent hydrolase [Candidatus Gottesmanbacteria bacterium]